MNLSGSPTTGRHISPRADFGGVSNAIYAFGQFLRQQQGVGKAAQSSQVFARLGSLRDVLDGESIDPAVPWGVLGKLSACGDALRAAAKEKKCRLRHRLRRVDAAQEILGQALALLKTYGDNPSLCVVETGLVPVREKAGHARQATKRAKTRPHPAGGFYTRGCRTGSRPWKKKG